MTSAEQEIELVPVTKSNPNAISMLLTLGRDYLSESDLSLDERERFLQSILTRQGETDRWLLLLKYEKEHLGFVHMKIDKDERVGWGFILEFYIIPTKRRLGWGHKLFSLSLEILRERGVRHIWLLTSPRSESFWHSLGFRRTGETENGQKVMTTSI
jgi:N-acetylglutamate synthase-like GNAT family acetyltransferase